MPAVVTTRSFFLRPPLLRAKQEQVGRRGDQGQRQGVDQGLEELRRDLAGRRVGGIRQQGEEGDGEEHAVDRAGAERESRTDAARKPANVVAAVRGRQGRGLHGERGGGSVSRWTAAPAPH
jgi:hypothetical protein